MYLAGIQRYTWNMGFYPSSFCKEVFGMRIGAQLYTVRQFTQTPHDLEETFRRLSSMGYTTVQLSAMGPMSPEVIREIADRNHLEIISNHTNPLKILEDVDAVIQEHKILGCPFIGIGGMPEKYRSAGWIDRFAPDFTPAAQKMAENGMKFMYHNHNFEWQTLSDGRKMINVLLETMPASLMGVTMDYYWLQAAGADVYEWTEKMSGRIPCVHFKDMAVSGFTPRFAAIGDGNMNYEKIVSMLLEKGETEYAFIEQDDCYGDDPFRCLERSYRTLERMGLK